MELDGELFPPTAKENLWKHVEKTAFGNKGFDLYMEVDIGINLQRSQKGGNNRISGQQEGLHEPQNVRALTLQWRNQLRVIK